MKNNLNIPHNEYKKTCNLGKLYLLPKIHKRLYDVLGRTVISKCGTPSEKILEFLDRQLKPIIQKSQSYIKDSGDFIRKIKNLIDIPEGAILVTADVVGLYPIIPHQAGLETLKKALDERENKFISTNDLVNMAEFVLKNNYFQFNGKVKQQPMLVCFWIKQKLIFLGHKKTSHPYGFAMLTMFFYMDSRRK